MLPRRTLVRLSNWAFGHCNYSQYLWEQSFKTWFAPLQAILPPPPPPCWESSAGWRNRPQRRDPRRPLGSCTCLFDHAFVTNSSKSTSDSSCSADFWRWLTCFKRFRSLHLESAQWSGWNSRMYKNVHFWKLTVRNIIFPPGPTGFLEIRLPVESLAGSPWIFINH